MLKKYDGTNWNTASYGKVFSGTEQFTNFPLVIRSLDRSVQAYTIKGNTQTSGTPSPSNPITIEGVGEETANLFDVNNETGITNNTYINQQGSLISNNSYYLSAPIAVQENTVYTWQFGGTISHTAPTTGFYDSTDTLISVATHTSGYNYSFTTPANCAYVRQSVYQYGKNEAMLSETPDVIPFEPYGFKISILKDSSPLTPIYLSQQLFKIGDTTDDYSSSGTATYNIRKLVITGEEIGWSQDGTYGSNNRYRLYLSNVKNTGTYITDFYNSHFKVQEGYAANTSVIWYGGSQYVYISVPSSDYPTLTDFKTWLQGQYAAGTPVIVYYILATPTTESVTAPSITTTGDTATIDIDTTVKPSEVSLTYNGKHLNKSKKFSVGNNLIPYPYYQGDGTVAGVTWTTYSDGRIVGTGKTKDEVQFKLADSLILSSGTYTISITGTHTGMSLLVRNKDNYTQVARIQSNDTSPVTFTISEEGRYEIYYNVLSYNVNVDIDCYIMLNLGSSALPYEPYGSWT